MKLPLCSRLLLGGLLLIVAPSCHAQNASTAPVAAASASSVTVTGFDKPFLFAYGSWEGKARVENGFLNVQSADNRGGLGDNLQPALNFAAYGNYSPLLKVRVNAGNKAKVLRVMLRDEKGGNATWNYSLEGVAVGQVVTLAPREGASLAQGNDVGKEGAPNLGALAQWQVQGDWGGDAVDVSVDEITLAAPDAAILELRTAREARLKAEAEKLAADRAELQRKYVRGPLSPRVSNVALVAPDVVAVTVLAGRVLPSSFGPYKAQPGDEKQESKNDKGDVMQVELRRGGQPVGLLVGAKRDQLMTYEKFEGDPLLEWLADDPKNFAVSQGGQTLVPTAVGRKSTPVNWGQVINQFEMRHTLYLKLPRALQSGQSAQVSLGALNTREPNASFVAGDAKSQSEAVHVNQIGYRPDDPLKTAFVSCWMGTGGALALPQTLRFSLVDAKTGKKVFSGTSSNIWRADKIEQMKRDANFSKTDVARLDFSGFKTPGTYRVYVEGVGSSYPFPIGANVWQRAFWTQMKGLYNQRSGMELGPPYTQYRKPRDMNPKDGYRVTKTTYRSVEKGGEAWADIPGGDTGQPANGWGGYHDAGDWNPRRVTHMRVTMAQLEVFEMFPAYFAPLKLNIPAQKGVPDILTEAQWEFDTFLRLQEANGGVGYGLESKGDPLLGETSWTNSFPSYSLAPDYLASWQYAAAGARLARLLAPYNPARAKIYRASVERAWNFAEADWKRDFSAGLTKGRGNTWEATDARNLAALELLKLTRNPKYHAAFLQNTVLKDATPELFSWGKAVQREHAFIYARLPKGLGDEGLKKKAVAALRVMADRSLEFGGNNAFGLTTPDKGKPQFLGYYSTPDASDLVRAHFLTKDAKYLTATLRATQFQSGANPANLVYMTGLGANPVKHVFKLDARRTGQPTPIGLVPYANIDFGDPLGQQDWITWPITWHLSRNTTPSPYDWPTNEAYWDLGGWPATEEFTVDIWAPNVLVWGYLAAR